MPAHPVIAVGVCVVRSPAGTPEILLIRRANPPHQGAWSLPGGRQNFGERTEDAARRELFEETGLTVSALTLIAAVDIIEDGFHYVVLDYAALWTGSAPRAGDDATDCAWWPIKNLAGRPVSPAIIAVAEAAAERVSFGGPSACRPAAAASSTDRP